MPDSEFRRSPDDLSNFRDWSETYAESIFPLLLGRYVDPTKVREIFDGGCGFGASTVALGRVFPESRIWACSKGEKPLPEVYTELGDRLHFEEVGIKDFLLRRPEVFDLIVLAKVPHHGFDTPEDYGLLASKVSLGGFVLAIKDSSLQGLMMEPNFKHIQVEPPTENDTAAAAICDLWQRV